MNPQSTVCVQGLTLKSRLSDVDLPCEIPAAITEPEWIIGPSWEHKAISTQRPRMGLSVLPSTETDSEGTSVTHSVVTFPTASPPTTDRITPDTLITSVWKQGRCRG